MRGMAREGRIIDVGLDEWETGERGDVLVADGIDSCAAVALSNLRTGRGYVGHFSQDSEVLEEMMQAARSGATTPAEVISWAGGIAPAVTRMRGEPEIPSQNRALTLFRARVMETLMRSGFRHDRALWLPPRNQLIVTLLCGTRQCRLQTAYIR